MALLGIALLAISAPLVSLFTLARAEEMAPDAAHALFFVSRGFALAFPCYAAAWLIFRALASKSLPAPPPTTDVARHVE